MKDRLLRILQEETMTSNKFAELMEVRPSNISHLLSGRNYPNFEFIGRMLKRFPNLNPYWLINGEGDMRKETSKDLFGYDVDSSVNKSNELFVSDQLGMSSSKVNDESVESLIQEELDTPKTPINRASLDLFTNVNSENSVTEPISETTSVREEIELSQNSVNSTLNDENISNSSGSQNRLQEDELIGYSSNTISKMVVFYSDKTFEIYSPR